MYIYEMHSSSSISSYTPSLSSVLQGGRGLHDEKWTIKDKTYEKNLAAHLKRNAYEYQERSNVPPPRLLESTKRGMVFAEWLGDILGKGAYGVAFRLLASAHVENLVHHFSHVIRGASIPVHGSTLVMKISTYDIKKEYTSWLSSCERENAVHKYVSSLPCVAIPGMATPICVKKHTPKFFCSGLFECPYTGNSFYITLMDLARGIPVNALLEKMKGVPSTAMYLEMERAAAALWMNGIVHADMHKGNMLYDGEKVTIIDFGFAVVLPDTLREKIRKRIAHVVVKTGIRSLGEIFEQSSEHGIANLQNHVNRVQHGRGASWYNPDMSAMLRMYSRLPRDERETVPTKRRAIWGVRTKSTKSTKASSSTNNNNKKKPSRISSFFNKVRRRRS